MKTEEQVLEKLEACTKELEAIADSLNPENENRDTVAKVSTLFGLICAYAWVLDQEKEIAEIFRLLRITQAVQKLEGLF